MGWLLAAGGSVALAALGVFFVHRVLPHHARQDYNDANGYFFSAIGVMYTVLLAFVVVSVWEQFGDARANTYAEANAIPGLYYSATVFPPDIRVEFQEVAAAYARDVVEDEWPRLADGQSSPKVDADAGRLRRAILRVQPDTPQQEALYSTMIERINTINSARRQRLNEAGASIPRLFWVGLIGGAILLILFGLFFGVPKLLPHLLMVIVLTVIIVGSLYLAYLMEQPFRGPMRLEPTAFQIVLTQLGR